MQKMVALSQCCFVGGIPGWGKPMLGRRYSCVEKDKEDVTDDQQIIVHWLLIICAVRLPVEEKTLRSSDSTAISLPSRNSPPQICWAPCSSSLLAVEESRSIYRRLFGMPEKSLAA